MTKLATSIMLDREMNDRIDSVLKSGTFYQSRSHIIRRCIEEALPAIEKEISEKTRQIIRFK